MTQGGNREGPLDLGLVRHGPPHDHVFAFAADLDVVRAVEVDHGSRWLEEDGLLRQLFDEDLRDAGRQLEALGVHQVALVAHLDPWTVARYAEDDDSGALDAAEKVVVSGLRICHDDESIDVTLSAAKGLSGRF